MLYYNFVTSPTVEPRAPRAGTKRKGMRHCGKDALCGHRRDLRFLSLICLSLRLYAHPLYVFSRQASSIANLRIRYANETRQLRRIMDYLLKRNTIRLHLTLPLLHEIQYADTAMLSRWAERTLRVLCLYLFRR